MLKQPDLRRNSESLHIPKDQHTHKSPRTPKTLRQANPRRNLRLVMLESALTHGSISVAIMTPFFISIGLNQAEIAAVQAVFTVVVMLLNFPTGWLADRFSRKWANVIGDLGCAVSYLCYSGAESLVAVIACESLLGLFMAFSQGVDFSLLKHFAEQLATANPKSPETREETFRRQSANLAVYQYLASIVLCLLGGPIGVISFRLAIAMNGLNYLVAGVVSLFIQDDSEKLPAPKTTPLADMFRIAKESFRNLRLRRRLIAYAVVREMTHGIIWVFTPMLLAVGVPLSIVSVAWALTSCASTIGARLARRFSVNLPAWQTLLIPLIIITCGLGAIVIDLNIVTVWCYLLVSIAQGWSGASALPLVQQEAPPSQQTSVISLAKVLGQFIYIPAVWIIGYAADFDLRYAAAATIIIFVPAGLYMVRSIRKES